MTDVFISVAWIYNHIHYKVWDEITYPFLNITGARDYLSMLRLKLIDDSKRDPR